MPDLLVLAAIDGYQEMHHPQKVWNLGQVTPAEFFGDEDLIDAIKGYLTTMRILDKGTFSEQAAADELYIRLGDFISSVARQKYPYLDTSDSESVVVLRIPEGASNVKLFYARNGNEEVTYELGGGTKYAEIVPWDQL